MLATALLFMYSKTFVIKLRLAHSAGLTIVNKDILPSLFLLLLLYDCIIEGKSKNITKHSNVWSLRKLVSLSQEISGLSWKQI